MYTHNFAIYCKSFRDDFGRLQLMLDSLVANENAAPLLLSVPSSDLSHLNSNVSLPSFVQVVEDESYIIPGEPFQQGWFQQQVCKLSVFRAKFSKSYAMIDSDTYFVKPVDDIRSLCDNSYVIASKIFTKYFQGNDDLLRYLLSEETASSSATDLKWDSGIEVRLQELNHKSDEIAQLHPNDKGIFINRIFNVPNLALQPSQFFHSAILEDFGFFLERNGMDFYDCIRIAPWEYNWYACYALTRFSGSVRGVCSPILHFASESDVIHAKSLGVSMEHIRRRFTAVQMAARHFERRTFED